MGYVAVPAPADEDAVEVIWRSCGDNKNGRLRIEYSLLGSLLVDTVKRRGDTEKISGPEKAFSALGGPGVQCYDSNILAATDSKRHLTRRQEILPKGGLIVTHLILPIQKIRLFSVQQNGQFLFVSNDTEGSDRVVEAHPFGDEERNFFQALQDDNGHIRFFHPSTNTFLFVSNDLAGPDRIVEAHPNADEERNKFEVVALPDGSFTFFNISTRTSLFLSNDKRGNDFVIEAHGPDELRNRFRVEL